jgi:hypothetical protein
LKVIIKKTKPQNAHRPTNLQKDIHTLKDEASAISFAQDQGLLLCRRTCVCGNPMKVRHKQTQKNNNYNFRCVKFNCKKEITIRADTFLATVILK